MAGERTILLTLDGSKRAEDAIPHGEALAKTLDASIRLVARVPRAPGMTLWPADVRTYAEDVRIKMLTTRLTELAQSLGEAGVTAVPDVGFGEPVESILAVAQAVNAAAIVMATHGQGGAMTTVAGSVAERVMRSSNRPTLVVRPSERPHFQHGVIKRVLVPLDGSPVGEAPLPIAEQIAAGAGATLVLLRAEPYVTLGSAPYGSSPRFAQIERETAQKAAAYLGSVRQRLAPSLDVEIRVERGAAAETISAFAVYEQIDLTVMGTHGRTGMRRMLMGSVAERTVRSGEPVLLLHPQATK